MYISLKEFKKNKLIPLYLTEIFGNLYQTEIWHISIFTFTMGVNERAQHNSTDKTHKDRVNVYG